MMNTRLIVASIAILELVGLATGRNCCQLVAETDAKDGFESTRAVKFRNVLDRLCAHRWIARTVGEEQAVKLFTVQKVMVPRYEINPGSAVH